MQTYLGGVFMGTIYIVSYVICVGTIANISRFAIDIEEESGKSLKSLIRKLKPYMINMFCSLLAAFLFMAPGGQLPRDDLYAQSAMYIFALSSIFTFVIVTYEKHLKELRDSGWEEFKRERSRQQAGAWPHG